MIGFLKKLLKKKCNHEVDMKFMEYPVCLHCSEKLHKIQTTSSGWEINPVIETWYFKKCILNTFKKDKK